MKRVVNSFYVHYSNLEELFTILTLEEKDFVNRVIIYSQQSLHLNFEIVKFNRDKKTVSLIKCPTWNILYEPIVEDSYCFDENLHYRIIRGGTKVYHNKWQFVAKNYQGFDYEDSKRRTEILEKIPNYKDLKCKIGNKSFWYDLLKMYNLRV